MYRMYGKTLKEVLKTMATLCLAFIALVTVFHFNNKEIDENARTLAMFSMGVPHCLANGTCDVIIRRDGNFTRDKESGKLTSLTDLSIERPESENIPELGLVVYAKSHVVLKTRIVE